MIALRHEELQVVAVPFTIVLVVRAINLLTSVVPAFRLLSRPGRTPEAAIGTSAIGAGARSGPRAPPPSEWEPAEPV